MSGRPASQLPASPAARRAKKRLRILLGLFFIGLAVPLAYLVHRVYSQFEHETRYRYRNLAENLVERVDQRIPTLLNKEEKRSFAEYSFFNVEKNPLLKGTGLTFSPLSQYPPNSNIPGIVGYFQINPDRDFGSPILPELDYGSYAKGTPEFSETELQNRLSLQKRLMNIINHNP